MSLMTRQPGQRFQNADVLRLFPTFLWKAELRSEIYEPLNNSILQALDQMGAPLYDLRPTESWQSHHERQERDEFRELVDCVNEAAESALAYLKVGHGSAQITGCWANLNASGAGHRLHNHPNNYLSGVYYVRTHPVPTASISSIRDRRPRSSARRSRN